MSEIFIPLSVAQKSKNNFSSRLLTTTALLSVAFFPQNASSEEKTTQLPTVTVIDSRSNGSYKTNESSYYKITGPLLDRPQSSTIVSQQLMKDQGVTTMRDALRNVPGVSIAAGEAGAQGDNLTIRGFSARSDFFIDGMRDYGSYYRDPFNMESIEVVQGPSSILFGRGSTGGVIQQNSKQAFLGSKSDGSIALGTNDTKRATADVNAKIPGLEGAAFRLNAMANTNKFANRDVAQNSRYGIAPTLSFGLGTDNRFTINFFHQNENDVPDYGLPWMLSKPARVNRNNFYGSNDDYLKTNADVLTTRFEHDLDDKTTFRNQTRYARYTRSTRITEPQVPASVTYTTPLESISVTRNIIAVDSVETYFGNQSDLTKKFVAFDMKHELVAGVSVEHESSDPTRTKYTGTSTTSLLSPSYNNENLGIPGISSSARAQLNSAGVYAIDTVHLDEKWQLLASLRFDHIQSDYSQTIPSLAKVSRTDNVFSYHEGLVYKPRPNGSIYIDYGTSFNPSAEQFSLISSNNANSSSLTPEKNTIYELGTKWDLFQKRLSTAFAIFRAEKANARETSVTNSSVITVGATQRVNGFQAQASGKITDAWKVMTSYAFMDSEVVKGVTNQSQTGNTLANVPRHTLNLFTTYKFPTKLEIGGGANLVSTRFASSAPDAYTGAIKKAPGYITLNAMAKYPIAKSVDLQLNITNLTNKFYLDQMHPGHVIPGQGRVFMLTTNFSF